VHNVSYHLSWRKRLFDVFFSATFLCVLTPVLLGIVAVIFFTAGYPVLFWQERMGHNKRPFKMLKFRTMSHGAEKKKRYLEKYNEAPWPMFKMMNDPRFTRFGRFLSRTGLDELPQLFQVLTGQMSLIGPRALPTKESLKLPKNWDFRYKVRPGIISDWAVATDRYRSLRRWRELEMLTVQRSSLREELDIVWQSIVFLVKSNLPFLKKSKVRLSRPLPRIIRQSAPVSSRERKFLRFLSP
jgi:lipopolysaccharide/colanic/teichoic acid biosynthesis glycosyltransferase